MSELAKTLELFGFLTIEDVTQETLKKSFKTRILDVHPDKGGDADSFDKMLTSYVYLTQTIQRISGGRATLQNILSPDELKRPDEIVNQFFQEFYTDDFNQQFEKQKMETHGYETWLKSDNVVESRRCDEKDLNTVFEQTFKSNATSIILHPEAMAICSPLGTSLVENDNYTSDVFSKPKYTDLYAAYTTDNTIYDKVSMKEIKSFDDILAERTAPITPLNDEELKAIQDFEMRKLNNDIKCATEHGFMIHFA